MDFGDRIGKAKNRKEVEDAEEIAMIEGATQLKLKEMV
ncbi:hypothetical protein BN424_1387 [Carnobacterium maltaromaticum LMA28]|uniref:Uncharacterized protein n=2 Tax=Carnobacterium maltaromaticum TaxID=2751 RepID=K8E3M3_CARML|nr:hypothetical protein BN424_1387 [Carnobacterium maltaromaticum LMA28]